MQTNSQLAILVIPAGYFNVFTPERIIWLECWNHLIPDSIELLKRNELVTPGENIFLYFSDRVGSVSRRM